MTNLQTTVMMKVERTDSHDQSAMAKMANDQRNDTAPCLKPNSSPSSLKYMKLYLPTEIERVAVIWISLLCTLFYGNVGNIVILLYI